MRVGSDFDPAQLDSLQLTVTWLGEGEPFSESSPVNPADLPLRVPVGPRDGHARIRVRAQGTSVDDRRVAAVGIAPFVADRTVALDLVLRESCLPLSCEDEQTCDCRGCQDVSESEAPQLLEADRVNADLSVAACNGDGPDEPAPAIPDAGPDVPDPGVPEASMGDGSDGDGEVEPSPDSGTPVDPPADDGGDAEVDGSTSPAPECPLEGCSCAARIRVGENSGCFVTLGGRGYCFGPNMYGQLARDPAQQGGTFPGNEVGIPGGPWKDIMPGDDHTCGLDVHGAVFCWGKPDGGLGYETAEDYVFVPTRVEGLPPIEEIAAGFRFGCALDGDGDAWCWQEGQTLPVKMNRPLVDPTRTYTALGQQSGQQGIALVDSAGQLWRYQNQGLQAVTGVTGVVEGFSMTHQCGRRANGVLLCAGENGSGQTGNGTVAMGKVDAGQVMGPGNFIQLGGSFRSTCAISAEGEPWCWGSPPVLYMSDTISGSPVRVFEAGDDPFVAVDSGLDRACALRRSGSLFCWNETGTTDVCLPKLDE